MKPQTIQIFLPEGSPTSVKEAELTNRLIQKVTNYVDTFINEVINGVSINGVSINGVRDVDF